MEFCLADLKAAMKRVITVAKTSIDAKYGGTFDFKGKHLVVKAVTTGRAKTQQKIEMMKEGEDFVASLNCKYRSEEHTSELQSRQYLVCRLLLEKKKKKK